MIFMLQIVELAECCWPRSGMIVSLSARNMTDHNDRNDVSHHVQQVRCSAFCGAVDRA